MKRSQVGATLLFTAASQVHACDKAAGSPNHAAGCI